MQCAFQGRSRVPAGIPPKHIPGSSLEAGPVAALTLRNFTLWLPTLSGLWPIRRE
jgi:hypothetical protein